MKFIRYQDAEIRWNEDRQENWRIKEFRVYECTPKDLDEWIQIKEGDTDLESHIKYYKDYIFSLGRCCSWWLQGSKDTRLYEMLNIIVDISDKNILKRVLLELGKIDEFECFRLLLWHKFKDILPDHSFEQFKEALYPDDMVYH